MFRDRLEAGRRLGDHLHTLLAGETDILVLGIPRGGVIVGRPVADRLGARLDAIVPRKIGAPGEPELAVGALAMAGQEEILVLDHQLVRQLAVSDAYLEEETARQRREIERRVAAYSAGREPVAGRTAVIVDDGIATGLTARVAALSVARLNPKQVLVAVPVAPGETVKAFSRFGLRLEPLETPSPFMAVGQFYRDFRQVEDDEVLAALRQR